VGPDKKGIKEKSDDLSPCFSMSAIFVLNSSFIQKDSTPFESSFAAIVIGAALCLKEEITQPSSSRPSSGHTAIIAHQKALLVAMYKEDTAASN
jgi:hypothetical protein